MIELLKWQRIYLIIGLILIFTGSVHGASKITCEDGDEFIIDEQQEVHIPDITTEKIVINIKQLRLSFYRDNVLIKSFPVAVGTSETPSPVGEWKIIHKGGSWGGGFGARWMGLNVPWGIYGIHGTDQPYSIGTMGSHGCIRMLNTQVIELYNMVKLGTPVYIMGDLVKVAIRSEMGRKSSGQDVLAVQYALRRAGFEPGNADGRFGDQMEQAVKRYQYAYGLPITGRLTSVELFLLGFGK